MVTKKAVTKKAVTKKQVVSKSTVSKKKAAVVKKKVVKKRAVRKTQTSSTISNEQHYLMVSEAAYHLSEQQGFIPGNDIDNWLKAEKQISAVMEQGNISLEK